mmetsp:Transcript_21583/g.64611  ORF Transcript_21583/g.64611 Transcript_21583/m.64611 type:complete len:253 (+) Transcript_21583:65-823(+)
MTLTFAALLLLAVGHRASSAAPRPLYFVHIPKTAGSTIELLGLRADFEWGLFSFCPGFKTQPHRTWWPACVGNFSRGGCVAWHDPAELARRRTATSFCVIRDPLDRMLSIYMYNRGGGPARAREGEARLCSLSDASAHRRSLNQWARKTVSGLRDGRIRNCNHQHLLPQAEFPCDRKLLFDELKTDFDGLMREHGLDLTFDTQQRARAAANCGNLTTVDFDPEVRSLIASYYSADAVLYEELKAARVRTAGR